MLDLCKTYVVEFDWRILETIDKGIDAYIYGGEDNFDTYPVPGIVAGDSGKAHFPLTLLSGSNFRVSFTLGGGGGKVTIDSIRVIQAGAGPWRRDFENGFVLVNPIHRSYTFSKAEVVGERMRTGIKLILGTQAPLVNNGQPVSGSLTLEPFEAIILLADQTPYENQLRKVYLPVTVKQQMKRSRVVCFLLVFALGREMLSEFVPSATMLNHLIN